MQLTSETKSVTITTETLKGTVSADEMKAAGMLLAKRSAGLSDDAIDSVSAELNSDGTVAVTIVKKPVDVVAPNAPASIEPPVPAETAPVTVPQPAPTIANLRLGGAA